MMATVDVQAQIAALWRRGPAPFRLWLAAEKAKGTKYAGWLEEEESSTDPLARYAIAVLGLGDEHFVDCIRETWFYSRLGGPESVEQDLPLWATEFMNLISDDYLAHSSEPRGITPAQALRFLGKALNRPAVKDEQRRFRALEPLLPLRLPKAERPWRVPA